MSCRRIQHTHLLKFSYTQWHQTSQDQLPPTVVMTGAKREAIRCRKTAYFIFTVPDGSAAFPLFYHTAQLTEHHSCTVSVYNQSLKRYPPVGGFLCPCPIPCLRTLSACHFLCASCPCTLVAGWGFGGVPCSCVAWWRLPVAGQGGAGQSWLWAPGPGTVPGSAPSPSLSQLGALTGFNPSKPAVCHTPADLEVFLFSLRQRVAPMMRHMKKKKSTLKLFFFIISVILATYLVSLGSFVLAIVCSCV